ncbi:hypothetical protein [Streptomyces sp. NPDC048710]|uniref:hypothetical protein n=1 Tax=Streptomyces sp. NPDC048710 TaxID=3365586 RepID=UPI003717CBBA
MRRFPTTALTTGALLAAALPVTVPRAWADDAPPPAVRTVTQEPGHPTILYPGREGTAAAYCPQGTAATGGGATVQDDPASAVYLRDSAPVGNGWQVRAYNSTNEVQTLHPRVICTTDTTVTHQAGPDVTVQQGEGSEYSTASCGSQYTVGGGGQAGPMTYLNMLIVPTSPMARQWLVRANTRTTTRTPRCRTYGHSSAAPTHNPATRTATS